MKRFALAVALTCALSATALAGSIPTSDVVAPQPDPVVTVILTIISLVV